MAAGSARVLSDLIDGRAPEIDMEGCGGLPFEVPLIRLPAEAAGMDIGHRYRCQPVATAIIHAIGNQRI